MHKEVEACHFGIIFSLVSPYWVGARTNGPMAYKKLPLFKSKTKVFFGGLE
jgi:hypothetical protein